MTALPSVTDLDPTVRQALARAIREFNSWRFYDCHETLEDIWREAGGKGQPATLADFYQGIIKGAAGFHHVLRLNYKGAVNLLSDALRLLDPYRPACLGIDVQSLVDGVQRSLDHIRSLGPGGLVRFDRALIPSIEQAQYNGAPE